jgi:hypothetical protein
MLPIALAVVAITAVFVGVIWDIFEDAVDVGRNEEMSAAS